jgi:hypothetical protein
MFFRDPRSDQPLKVRNILVRRRSFDPCIANRSHQPLSVHLDVNCGVSADARSAGRHWLNVGASVFDGRVGTQQSQGIDHDPDFGVALDQAGVLYIAEFDGGRIRKVDARGVLTTIAGDGSTGYSGDGGLAKSATFNGLHTHVVTLEGVIYVADLDNRRIRAINLETGLVDTVAGNGEKGIPDDGAVARNMPLVDPRAVAADRHGNIYVLERGGHALRVVTPDGKMTIRVLRPPKRVSIPLIVTFASVRSTIGGHTGCEGKSYLQQGFYRDQCVGVFHERFGQIAFPSSEGY